MHVETAAWTRAALAGIDLPAGSRTLDIGSSTLHFRTVEQPHIEREVLAPLRARGARIVHLDAKPAPGSTSCATSAWPMRASPRASASTRWCS